MKFFLVQKIAKSHRFVNRMRDELVAAKDAKRGEESMLSTLNDVIAEALADIETLKTDVEILDGENNGAFGSLVAELVEVAESSRLTNKMKVVFDQARREEASFEALMRDVCCLLRVSLSKKRRLATELEALGQRESREMPLGL
nr:hypothetical protein [Tanacetum cinerariifolium]